MVVGKRKSPVRHTFNVLDLESSVRQYVARKVVTYRVFLRRVESYASELPTKDGGLIALQFGEMTGLRTCTLR